MTKTEKSILRGVFAMILGILIIRLCGQTSSKAEEIKLSSDTQATTATHWSIISEDSTREAWKILNEEYSEVATAAILGNLHWESGMCPYRLEGLTIEESEKNIGFYTASRNKFIYMNYGFGLACWTGTTNLSRLWDWCDENGYDVTSLEGQVRFLMEDYPLLAEASHKRMSYYGLDDIVTATEDFRQSYEKGSSEQRSQYNRAKLAKTIYASFCQDIYTIATVSNAPMHYDIYMKVKELNEKILKEEN